MNDHLVRVEEALAENIRQQIIDGTTAAGAGYDRVTLTWDQARTVLASLARAPHPIEAQGSETELLRAARRYIECSNPAAGLSPYISENGRYGTKSPWVELREAVDVALTRPDPSLGGEDAQPFKDALHDLVHLLTEQDMLNGGGPGFGERYDRALSIATDLVRIEE